MERLYCFRTQYQSNYIGKNEFGKVQVSKNKKKKNEKKIYFELNFVFLNTKNRDYMNARRVAKELENITKGLNRNLPAIPPNLSKEEVKQVN